jgi:hypothetical protein
VKRLARQPKPNQSHTHHPVSDSLLSLYNFGNDVLQLFADMPSRVILL